MHEIKQIEALLEEKKQQLLVFEASSQSLLVSDVEQMEVIVNERDVIIQTVNDIDAKMKNIPVYQQNESKINAAIKNKVNRDDIESEYISLFDKGQELFAIVNRISKMENLIARHIEDCRKELEQKIKDSNTLPKIQRYLDTIPNELEDGSLIRSNFKKI